MKTKRMIVAAVALTLALAAYAQTDSTEYMRGYAAGVAAAQRQQGVQSESQKIITNSRIVGIGTTNILDTYISPEKYTGTELRYVSHIVRERSSKSLSHEIVHQGYLSIGSNRADTGDALAGMYTLDYGVHYNWHLYGNSLTVRAGAMAELNAGFLYNTRNGNNPAQARLGFNVSPSAAATYRFMAWNHRVAVNYEVSAPLVGLMFSPNYGQSYYEIFTRGDYDHNVVPTTFVNAPSLRQMLTFDFYIRKTGIRIGYLCDIQQAKVNDIKYHNYSNIFLIGIVKHFDIIKSVP